MTAQFIQTCITPTPLLTAYEEAKTRKAGKEIKKVLLQEGSFSKFDLFQDYHVKVETMKHENQKYAIVTHSQINHLFLLEN